MRPERWQIIAAAIIFVVATVPTYDQASRYLSWQNLSKEEIVASADWYIENRAPGERACLYAVVCEDGRARLDLIKDMEGWNIEATRELVWDRKFSGACPGGTANFALQMLPSDPPLRNGRERAIWSFYNDRFVPISGHFHGPHAFSEIAPEQCSEEYVITK